jgi:hypothetical protein
MSEPNKDMGAKDDPRSAPESGEQKESGRTGDRSGGTGKQPEEGRHEAAPRTGG